MKKIVFFLTNAPGHYYSCFHLAQLYSHAGYQVVFTGPEERKSLIEENGFTYYFLNASFTVNNEGISASAFTLIQTFFKSMLTPSAPIRARFNAEVDEIRVMLEKLNPEIVMLDIFRSRYYVVFKSLKQKCVLVQTMVATNYSRHIPPLHSASVPDGKNEYSIQKEWKKYWRKKKTITWIKSLTEWGNDSLSLFKNYARQKGYRFRDLFDMKRSFHPGIPEIPEVVMGPRAFDYPFHKQAKYQLYYGLPEYGARPDARIDKNYESVVEQIKKVKSEGAARVLYCSLGTIPEQHSSRFYDFFLKLVDGVMKRSDLFCVISAGSLSDAFLDLPGNVKVLSRVPQPQLLSLVDLFITHGGLNSILESLRAGTPMLVYPLSDIWDQNGNAARVVYHQLGLSGNIANDSEKEIFKKVDKLLEDDLFKKRLQSFLSEVDQLQENLVDRIFSLLG